MQFRGSKFCISLLFTCEGFDRIIAVFIFYSHWARARRTAFASATPGWQVMAVLPLLNQSVEAITLAS